MARTRKIKDFAVDKVKQGHDLFVSEESHLYKPDNGFKGEFKLIAHTDGLNNGIVTVAYVPADGERLTLEDGTRVTGPQIFRLNVEKSAYPKGGTTTVPEPLSYNLNEAEDLSRWDETSEDFIKRSLGTYRY